jgi:hypothetical protein
VTEITTAACTCLDDGMWRCVDGDVYGPCSSGLCGGVCEYDGRCTCPATVHKPGTHGVPDAEDRPVTVYEQES